MLDKGLGSRIFNTVNAVFLLVVAAVCLFPFLNILAQSLSSSSAAAAGRVSIFPVGLNIESYRYVFKKPEFIRAFLVSLLRTVVGLSLSLFVTVLAAYPLSKRTTEFKARNRYMWFFFVTMLFSGGLIPFYMTVRTVGLIGSIWGLIVPWIIMAYTLILMVGFFRSIPKELTEAAIIDGASHWRVLWNILVPISLPGIATIGLIIGVFFWNEWFFGLIFTSNATGYPLQSYLQTTVVAKTIENMGSASQQELEAMAKISDRTMNSAQIIIAMVPVIVVYPFVQKYFVKGLILGGVKG